MNFYKISLNNVVFKGLINDFNLIQVFRISFNFANDQNKQMKNLYYNNIFKI